MGSTASRMEVVFALEEDMRQFPEELRKRKWSASEEWTDRRKRPSTRSRETRYPQVDDRDERAFETFECIPSQNEGTLGSLGGVHQTPAGASSSVRSGSDSRDPAGDHLDSVDTTVRKDDDASQIGIDTEDETTRGVNTELTYCVNGLCVYRIYE